MLENIKLEKEYILSFKYNFLGIFPRKKEVFLLPDFSEVYSSKKTEDKDYYDHKLTIFDISIDGYLGYRDIFISNKYINNFTIWIHSVKHRGTIFLVLEILDIRVNGKYRRLGIGGQLMKVVDEIAKENNVKCIIGNLQVDTVGEPLSGRIRFFRRHGFEVEEKLGSGFSGFIIKKNSIRIC